MTKLRTVLGALIASGALAAGVLGFAPAANADPSDPCPPIDFVLVYADRTGAAYSINNTSLQSFGDVENLLGPCLYEGDLYYNGTDQNLKHRFERPLFWHL